MTLVSACVCWLFYVGTLSCEFKHGFGLYCFLLLSFWQALFQVASVDLISICLCWCLNLMLCWSWLLSSSLRCRHCWLCINICWWRARYFSSRLKFAMPDKSFCTGGGFAFRCWPCACWSCLVQFGSSCFPLRWFWVFLWRFVLFFSDCHSVA